MLLARLLELADKLARLAFGAKRRRNLGVKRHFIKLRRINFNRLQINFVFNQSQIFRRQLALDNRPTKWLADLNPGFAALGEQQLDQTASLAHIINHFLPHFTQGRPIGQVHALGITGNQEGLPHSLGGKRQERGNQFSRLAQHQPSGGNSALPVALVIAMEAVAAPPKIPIGEVVNELGKWPSGPIKLIVIKRSPGLLDDLVQAGQNPLVQNVAGRHRSGLAQVSLAGIGIIKLNHI